jgi:cation diffusion facilitator CzcD-associated flavoprotein CzcO
MLDFLQSQEDDPLVGLADEARRQIETMRYPGQPWLRRRNSASDPDVLDVLIVGGGQSGLAIAFALKRMCIENTLVIDAESEGLEGPWLRFARMKTLRTPRHLTGVDNGIPALTPKAWFVAKYGEEAWEQLGRIPRADWASYLGWFRSTAGIRVANNTRLLSFSTCGMDRRFINVRTRSPHGDQVLKCRRLVFATGIDGSGCWHVPEEIAGSLPEAAFSHTSGPIDFAALKGKRIGVLGAGASAFDNAGVALETGAEAVHLFYRRKNLPRINPFRWMENRGFLEFYADLPDAKKWRFFELILRNNQPPPQDTFDRCAALIASVKMV